MDTMQLILSQLGRIEHNQEKLSDQLSQLSARLLVVEHSVMELHQRMDTANGCTAEMGGEIDELQSAVERLEDRHWSRGDKIRAIGIALSAVFAVAALAISIICH